MTDLMTAGASSKLQSFDTQQWKSKKKGRGKTAEVTTANPISDTVAQKNQRQDANRADARANNSPSAKGAGGCFACFRKAASDMSDRPMTLSGHIHDPMDHRRTKANAEGHVRDRNGRSRKQVRDALSAFAVHFTLLRCCFV